MDINNLSNEDKKAHAIENYPNDDDNIQERIITLDRAIEALALRPPKEQIVILARFLGLNYKEIIQMLGYNEHKANQTKEEIEFFENLYS